MNELFVIDIPEENYTTIAAGQGKKESIEVDDGDDALMLEDLDVKDKSIEGEEVELEMLPLPEPRYRSYFETDENNPSGEHRPVEEPRPPIVLTSATKYLKWTILTPSRVQSTHYDVVLGISTKRLNLDTVEAIIITVQYYPSRYTSAAKSEVINPQELRRLCSIEAENDDICFRWKLHEKLVLFIDAQPITFAVEVKTWQDQPLDYGSIEFHYSEILTDSVAYYKDDPMYREHRPFLSTVDVNRTGYSQLDTDLAGPKRILGHTVSGDGSHVLVTILVGELKLLQLWRFEEPQSVESRRSGQESDYPCQSHRSAGSLPNDTFQPYLVAWMQLPMADDYECCLSWDATQFAYVDLTRLYDPLNVMLDVTNYTSFYKVDANYTQVPAGAIAGRGFRRFSVEEQCPGLDGFVARAAFHIIATQNQDVKDELFVTCDGITIEIYSVFGDWTHLRSILINPSQKTPRRATINNSALTKNLRGPHLVLKDSVSGRIATWDIKQGTRLSSYTQRIFGDVHVAVCSAMSKDGNLIAVAAENHVDIYLTTTWTLAASYIFDDMQPTRFACDVQFIRNDTQIMVSLAYQNRPFYQHNRGVILNVSNMSMVEEYIVQGCDAFRMTLDDPIKPQAICVGISQLSLFDLQDRTVQSPYNLQARCGDSCSSIASFKGQFYTEATAPSGMRFKVEKTLASAIVHDRRKNLPIVAVTVSDKNGQVIQRIAIRLPDICGRYSATFVGECSYLVLSLKGLLIVWKTPTSPQDTFTIQLVHIVEFVMDWKVCPHQQLYGYEPIRKTVCEARSLADPLPRGSGSEFQFMQGFVYLQDFKNAGDFAWEEIIQYFGKYINLCRPGAFSDTNIIHHFCSRWKAETHSATAQIWRDILAHPTTRWIPRYDMVWSNNPILILLHRTDEHPEAFELAKVFIDYCIRQAKLEKDPHFLLPIRQCLQQLTDPKRPYSEVTQELFRELAYLPARERNHILERHSIVHPFEFRLQFWKPNLRGLHQDLDQVLQLTLAPTVNPPKNNFTRNFYLATFDMLWFKTDAYLASSDDLLKSKGGKDGFSWRTALGSLFMHISRLNHNSTVECHPFELETLDNPAIAALVEYKWNTIGLQFWLLRFLAQFVYYVLVLVGVFMQIYHYDNESAVNGIFIAIIVFSSVFLWLEFVQMIKGKRGYFESVYNLIDLPAFAFPLAGSILQLVWSDLSAQNTLLSFSVLFIFLHFLFELRVIRGVCKFVSIIIYIISSIRVFFFVFAGGILAFSVAIMHLLHTCTDAETCPSFTEGFSLNIFRALSMTYFLMGGRYDQVSNGFSNNDVGFHLMMAVFFFFTVIIMLNVLIALINHAFDDGDSTWELEWLQNRMRYVESAENLTYDIPGFRAAHDFFPGEIYYTATPLQVREYRKNTQRILEEKSAVIDASTPVVAETKMQVPVSGDVGGGGGGSSSGGHDQQRQEIFRADAGAGEGDVEGALMAMLKQFQEEQKQTRTEQQQAREEQQRIFEELRLAREEQQKTATELRKEVALLKDRLEANREKN